MGIYNNLYQNLYKNLYMNHAKYQHYHVYLLYLIEITFNFCISLTLSIYCHMFTIL